MSRQVFTVPVPAPAAPASQPLVSVIIPTRNRADLLVRSVYSVLAQTYRQFELIVVNDASTDHTRDVLAAIDDPRLRILHREKNKCAGAARNAGLELARGELIAFHDDDDVWLPDKLAKQVAVMAAQPASTALCLCGRIFIENAAAVARNPRARVVRYMGGERLIRALDFSFGNGNGGPDYSLIATPGWLVRKAALDRVGNFDERIRSWDDWELGLRLWLEYDFAVLDEPLYIQDFMQGGGLTRLERARADDIVVIDEKHGRLWADKPDVLARHAYLRGLALFLSDAAPAGREDLWRSVRLHPWRMRAWIFLSLTYVDRSWARSATNLVRYVKGKLWHLIYP